MQSPRALTSRSFRTHSSATEDTAGTGASKAISFRQRPPQDRFLPSTMVSLIRSHVLLIASMTLCERAGTGDPNLFLRNALHLPSFPFDRIISRLALAIVFGTAVWNFLDLGYSVVSLGAYFGTFLLRRVPFLPRLLRPPPFDARAWPPLLRNPLLSDSLADWWTYRWHRCDSLPLGSGMTCMDVDGNLVYNQRTAPHICAAGLQAS